MTYSIIGILASVILLITNHDLLLKGRVLTRRSIHIEAFLQALWPII
ncbi:MAG: hypothetical protein K5886_11265 [Lachnospiraceae bacterium]|nr:hypothetical protein [Lachnospiraceae bacterium]